MDHHGDDTNLSCPIFLAADLEFLEEFGFWVEGVVQTSLAILGIIGNVLASVVLTRKSMRNSFNLLLVSLACFDSTYLFGAILESFRKTFRLASTAHIVLFPHLLYPFHQVAISGSIFMTVAIALERYIAVHYPLDYNQSLTDSGAMWRRVAKYLCPVFVMAFLFNCVKFFEATVIYVAVSNGTNDTAQLEAQLEVAEIRTHPLYSAYNNWSRLLVLGILPFILLVFFNKKIYRDIVERRRRRMRCGRAWRRPSDSNLMTEFVSLPSPFWRHKSTSGRSRAGERETDAAARDAAHAPGGPNDPAQWGRAQDKKPEKQRQNEATADDASENNNGKGEKTAKTKLVPKWRRRLSPASAKMCAAKSKRDSEQVEMTRVAARPPSITLDEPRLSDLSADHSDCVREEQHVNEDEDEEAETNVDGEQARLKTRSNNSSLASTKSEAAVSIATTTSTSTLARKELPSPKTDECEKEPAAAASHLNGAAAEIAEGKKLLCVPDAANGCAVQSSAPRRSTLSSLRVPQRSSSYCLGVPVPISPVPALTASASALLLTPDPASASTVAKRLHRRHVQTINERRRRIEDNLAAIFMGFVLVFLVCHFPRLLLNIHELVTIREALECTDSGQQGFSLWSLVLIHISHFLLVLNSSTNCLIYCLLSSKFREECRALVRRISWPRHSSRNYS